MAARDIAPIHLLLCRAKATRAETTRCVTAVPPALSLTCFCSASMYCSRTLRTLSISSWCLFSTACSSSCSLYLIFGQEKSYWHLPSCSDSLFSSLKSTSIPLLPSAFLPSSNPSILAVPPGAQHWSLPGSVLPVPASSSYPPLPSSNAVPTQKLEGVSAGERKERPPLSPALMATCCLAPLSSGFLPLLRGSVFKSPCHLIKEELQMDCRTRTRPAPR